MTSYLSGITSSITKGLTDLKTGAEEAGKKIVIETTKAAITTAVNGLDPVIDKLCALEIYRDAKLLLQNEIIINLKDKLQKLEKCNQQLKETPAPASASKAKYLKYKLKYLELKKKINTA